MSRIHSRRLSSLFAPRKSRDRRNRSRSRERTLEVLEPRTLLSNTWYVNSSFSGTSDGSQSDPFTTIQAAISGAGAGDLILVETGNGYNESDTVNVADLTIDADTGQTPVLDGTTPIAQTSPGLTMSATGVTIAGLTIQNFSGSSAIDVQNGSLTLSSDVIQENSVPGGFGGGIINQGTLILTNDTVSGNSAVDGGGIFNQGMLTVTNDTVSGNSASQDGGGIFNLVGGTVTLTNDTLSGNSAGVGGGIAVISGTVMLTNDTVSGNSATSGGGIAVFSSTVMLTNDTVSGNSAVSGGGVYVASGTVKPGNTIIAGNTRTDVNGTVRSQGYNLIGSISGSGGWVSTDLTGIAPFPRSRSTRCWRRWGTTAAPPRRWPSCPAARPSTPAVTPWRSIPPPDCRWHTISAARDSLES